MNQHTKTAKEWLDRRYSRDSGGGYLAHQPICGLRTERAEPNAILRFARTYRLLELLHSLEFDSFLDVGGGEGYLAALVRDLFGVKTAHSSDLSAEACSRAREIFSIDGAAADSTRLPFASKSYDVVLCSEVIEHLSRPVLAIGELARIARKYVVISTAEFCPAGEVERMLRGLTLDRSYPHAEVNWFTAGDFASLLGSDIAIGAQYRRLEQVVPAFEANRARVEKVLDVLTASHTLDVDHTGVIVIAPRNGARVPAPVRVGADERRRMLDRLLDPPAPRPAAGRAKTAVSDAVVSRLACLQCRSKVDGKSDGSALVCVSCGQAYELRNGIAAMFADAPDDRDVRSLEDECVATLSGGDAVRERAVREVIARLHNNESRNNPEWKQRIANQLLRVVWVWYRDEPLSAKIARLLGRVAGKPPAGYQEVRAALVPSAEAGARTVESRV
jgi:ubiquinone/menaquinone biosynthesis C-methylase UbiE